MNVVNPNNTSHELNLIPRWEPIEVLLVLYNEETQTITNVASTFNFVNGYLNIFFNYNFVEGQKFQVKITDEGAVLYRGKLMATAKDTQTFKASTDLYYYE